MLTVSYTVGSSGAAKATNTLASMFDDEYGRNTFGPGLNKLQKYIKTQCSGRFTVEAVYEFLLHHPEVFAQFFEQTAVIEVMLLRLLAPVTECM